MAKHDVYLDVLNRIEPDITCIDTSAGIASIAISLKRIADILEKMLEIKEEEHNDKHP